MGEEAISMISFRLKRIHPAAAKQTRRGSSRNGSLGHGGWRRKELPRPLHCIFLFQLQLAPGPLMVDTAGSIGGGWREVVRHPPGPRELGNGAGEHGAQTTSRRRGLQVAQHFIFQEAAMKTRPGNSAEGANPSGEPADERGGISAVVSATVENETSP